MKPYKEDSTIKYQPGDKWQYARPDASTGKPSTIWHDCYDKVTNTWYEPNWESDYFYRRLRD